VSTRPCKGSVDGERKVAASTERAQVLNVLSVLRDQYHKPIEESNITEESLEAALRDLNEVEGVNWELVRAAVASSVLEHAIAEIQA